MKAAGPSGSIGKSWSYAFMLKACLMLLRSGKRAVAKLLFVVKNYRCLEQFWKELLKVN